MTGTVFVKRCVCFLHIHILRDPRELSERGARCCRRKNDEVCGSRWGAGSAPGRGVCYFDVFCRYSCARPVCCAKVPGDEAEGTYSSVKQDKRRLVVLRGQEASSVLSLFLIDGRGRRMRRRVFPEEGYFVRPCVHTHSRK